jgi:hypothetical protein
MTSSPLPKALIVALALAASATLIACGGDDDGDDGGAASAVREGNEELLTSAGFTKAVDAMEGEAGADAPLLRVQINLAGAEFQVREGDQAGGFIYTGGELAPIEIEVLGSASLEGQDFPLSQVDPAAIDKIVEGVKAESGLDDVVLTNLLLEKQAKGGEQAKGGGLKWVINATGGGRTDLVFNADLDGSNVTSVTAADTKANEKKAKEGTEETETEKLPPLEGAGKLPKPTESQKKQIAECVERAEGDPEELAKCGEIAQ